MYGHIIINGSLCTTQVIIYNLVSFIFGTTIPTSFNILMKCFLHLCKDGTDMKWLQTLKWDSYMPFQSQVFLHTIKLSKYVKLTTTITYRKLLNFQFLHLLYQTAFLKIGKHTHLNFGIKCLLCLLCMILGHQNLARILLLLNVDYLHVS